MAEKMLGIKISPRGLNDVIEDVGNEFHTAEEARTADFCARGFRTPAPPPPQPLEMAVVQVDGGRIQTRRTPAPTGVHGKEWKENKAALFLRAKRMHHGDFDPHPELPTAFVNFHDRAEEKRLEKARRSGGKKQACKEQSPVPEPLVDGPKPPDSPPQGNTKKSPRARKKSPQPSGKKSPRWSPKFLFKTCLTAVKTREKFGWDMAAEADSRGFSHAELKVFLGDGQKYNWNIRKLHFNDYVPILDFVHALEYAHGAAKAVGKLREPEPGTDLTSLAAETTNLRLKWAKALWAGEVERVIAEIEAFQRPRPTGDIPKDHPWKILKTTAGYFRNNRLRMRYPEYRRRGLPVTSSGVESLIRQINGRTKGAQMFWGRSRDAILSLRGAVLSEDDRLDRFLRNRPGLPWSRKLPTPPAAAPAA